jgi:sterol desaturase/sphingolipid hydroxylase (fatty acid hydroxylase superfamily)
LQSESAHRATRINAADSTKERSDMIHPQLLTSAVWFSLVIVMVLEYQSSKSSHTNSGASLGDPSRTSKNLTLGIIHRLLVTPFILAPLMANSFERNSTLPSMPFWLQLVLTILILDFTNYAIHIAAHKVPLLWRFHKIHHMDLQMDATTGLRIHVGEKILSLPIKMLVVSFCGISPIMYLIYEAISASFGVFHHSSIPLPSFIENACAYILAVPRFHHIHHHDQCPQTDSNYGFVLSIWDHLFQTATPIDESFKPHFGLDTDHETTLEKLLLKPFHSIHSLKDIKHHD